MLNGAYITMLDFIGDDKFAVVSKSDSKIESFTVLIQSDKSLERYIWCDPICCWYLRGKLDLDENFLGIRIFGVWHEINNQTLL